MRLRGHLANDCPTGDVCPRIIDTDSESVLVQGSLVTDPAVLDELDLPGHEAVIEVPRSLIYGRRIMDVGELGAWISQHHTRDLFRLEVRDRYTVGTDGDDFQRYLNGAGQPDTAAKQPRLARLAADTAAGRVRRKVHLVRGPLSDYQRYEFEWGFVPNTQAGEQIRILESDADRSAALVEVGDVFVLDAEHVLRNLYDDVGRFLGAHVVYGGEAVAIRAMIDWIWEAAEPFAQWWERHPEFHRDR